MSPELPSLTQEPRTKIYDIINLEMMDQRRKVGTEAGKGVPRHSFHSERGVSIDTFEHEWRRKCDCGSQ